MSHVYCLDCDRRIVLHAHVLEGDQIVCSSCDAEFQVVSVSPVEIEWLYDDYEDDEEYDDDDDDEEEEEEEWAHLVAKQRRHANFLFATPRRRLDALYE